MRRALLLSGGLHALVALALVPASSLFGTTGPDRPPPEARAEMVFADPGSGAPSPVPTAPPEPARPPAPPLPSPGSPPLAATPAPPAEQPEVRLNGESDTGGSTPEITGEDIPVGPDPAAPNRPPRYPADAARRGEQGEVVLAVAVAPDGAASAVSVYLSSGFATLDGAARDAVARWRFKRRTEAGLPVASRTLIRVRFRLD